MASIPLPALSVRVPQQQDPVENYVKLKSLLGNQQLQQQQIQAGQLENQQRTNDLQSQQAIKDAYTEAGGDLKKTVMLAAKKGARPADLIKLQQASIEQQKQNLDLLNAKGARAIQEADLMQGVHDQISKLPPEQRAAAYPQGIQALANAGIDTSKMPQDYPGDQAFEMGGIALKGHKQQLEDLAKQADIAKTVAQTGEATAKTGESTAQTAKIQQETGTGEAAYRQTLAKLQAGQPVTPQEMSAAKAYEFSQRKTTATSDSLGIKSVNTSGPAGLASVGRGAVSSGGGGVGKLSGPANDLVDQIGTGKMALGRLEMIMSRRPELAEAVAQKYPDFDSSKVKSYIDAYKSFTSGPDAKQVNAGAVAIQHLAQLKKINDESPTEARIPGTAAYKAFHNLLDTVADELGTFYGEPKTNEVIESKKSTLGGLTNRDAAIVEQSKAMGVKFDEMEQKWKNAAPSSAYQAPMPNVSDAAKKARASLDPEYAQRQGESQGKQPTQGGANPQTAPTQGAPAGATGIAPGSDGKRHYHDAKGNDLGIAP